MSTPSVNNIEKVGYPKPLPKIPQNNINQGRTYKIVPLSPEDEKEMYTKLNQYNLAVSEMENMQVTLAKTLLAQNVLNTSVEALSNFAQDKINLIRYTLAIV